MCLTPSLTKRRVQAETEWDIRWRAAENVLSLHLYKQLTSNRYTASSACCAVWWKITRSKSNDRLKASLSSVKDTPWCRLPFFNRNSNPCCAGLTCWVKPIQFSTCVWKRPNCVGWSGSSPLCPEWKLSVRFEVWLRCSCFPDHESW